MLCELSESEREAIVEAAQWLSDDQVELTERFYKRFFERYPEAAALFGRHSQIEQAQMLHETLVIVLDHLDDASWLDDYLIALGHRHADYDVTGPMYDWFSECLLEAFEELLGERWQAAHTSAWRKIVAAVCDRVRSAADRRAVTPHAGQ